MEMFYNFKAVLQKHSDIGVHFRISYIICSTLATMLQANLYSDSQLVERNDTFILHALLV